MFEGKTVRAAVVLAAMMGVAVGCGDDSDDAGGSGGTVKVPGVSGSTKVAELSSSEWLKVCAAGGKTLEGETAVGDGLCVFYVAVLGGVLGDGDADKLAAECNASVKQCRSEDATEQSTDAGATSSLCENDQPMATCKATVDEVLSCYREMMISTWKPLAAKSCEDVYDFEKGKVTADLSPKVSARCTDVLVHCFADAEDGGAEQ